MWEPGVSRSSDDFNNRFNTERCHTKNGETTYFIKYEEPTIRAFIAPEKRDRYTQLLSKPIRRQDALNTLYHAIAFDPRWAKSIKSSSGVVEMLQASGAESKGYLIGTSKDQCILPLDEAIARVEYESGIVVCIPGRLAYYCGENGERRMMLERGIATQNP